MVRCQSQINKLSPSTTIFYSQKYKENMDNKTLETFTLALKVGQQQIKFVIRMDDDQDRLYQKLIEIYPQCKDKRDEVLEKLKADLEAKIKSNSVKANIKPTIETFLKKTFPTKTKERAKIVKQKVVVSAQREDTQKKNNQIEEKQQPGQNQIQHSQKIQEKIVQISTQVVLKASPRLKNSKQNIKKPSQYPDYWPNDFNKNQYRQKQKKSFSKPKIIQAPRVQSLSKDSQNQDVVKACQTILQKTNQNDMKSMAKKYLQDLGRLPAQDKKLSPLICQPKFEMSIEEQKSIIKDEQSPQGVGKSQIQPSFYEMINQKPEEKQQIKVETINKSIFYRSPIQGINYSTQKNVKNQLMFNKSINQFRQSQNKSFRGNRYNYMSSLQQSFLPIDTTHYQCSPRQSHYRKKRFSYLQSH